MGGESHKCGVRGFDPMRGDTRPACDTVPVRSALDRAKDGLASRERIRAEANPRRYYENALVADNGEKGSAQKTNIGSTFDWNDLSALVLDHEQALAELAVSRQRVSELEAERNGLIGNIEGLRTNVQETTRERDEAREHHRQVVDELDEYGRVDAMLREKLVSREAALREIRDEKRDLCAGGIPARLWMRDRAAREVGRA